MDEHNPIVMLQQSLDTYSYGSHTLLNIGGYYNAQKWNLDENILIEKIEELVEGKTITIESLRFLDITAVLEDELFQRFEEKLNSLDLNQTQHKEMRTFALKIMMGSKK